MHADRDIRHRARPTIPGGVPSVRYSEKLLIPRDLLRRVNLADLERAGWVPIDISGGVPLIAAIHPGDEAVALAARRALGVDRAEMVAITPEDLARTIANNRDVNPGFPPQASRNDLARVRTYLANRRSFLASRRTVFSRGRTGLAIFRTGLAFLTVVLLLVRIFGVGLASVPELVLLAAALFLLGEGLHWYLPARKVHRRGFAKALPPLAKGMAVLMATVRGNRVVFERSEEVPADTISCDWDALTPVMRRRFMALERTDLAEERSSLAYDRTLMAMSRTGMALGRTGIALAGIGSALVRQFSHNHGVVVGWALIAVGGLMALEGFSWYWPGRRVGRTSSNEIKEAEAIPSFWDMTLTGYMCHAKHRRCSPRDLVEAGSAPGMLGTTGLALERTLLAERRNVMARLRTHMARARTGLAFVRTGMNCTAVGLGLMVSFGFASPAWAVFDIAVLALGAWLVTDGLMLAIPAERLRHRLPFCSSGLEIAFPDYTRPSTTWASVVFDDAD